MANFRIFEVKIKLPGVDEQTIYVGARNGHEINKWAEEKEIVGDSIITETDYTEETLKADGKELAEKAFKEEKPAKKIPELVEELVKHGWRKANAVTWSVTCRSDLSVMNNVWVFFGDYNRLNIKQLDDEEKKIVKSGCVVSNYLNVYFDVSYENEGEEHA